MKLSTLFLASLLTASAVFAEPAEWWIDFGTGEYSSLSGRGKRTVEAGWNNVSVGYEEVIDLVFDDGTPFYSKTWNPQVSQGAAKLSNVYFADTISKDSRKTEGTYQTWTKETERGKFNTVYEVDIFDSKNSGNNLSLSITKDSKGGNLMTNTGKQASAAMFGANDIADIPETVYADGIGCIPYDASDTAQKGGSNGAHQFTITLTGLNAGKYDITIITATNSAGSVYGGTERPELAITLNDSSIYDLLGEGDMTGSGVAKYADVVKWDGFTIDESGKLEITIKGCCLVHSDCDSATCTEKHTAAYINALMVSESLSIPESPAVPEPATATLSLLALCGLAARRRRC